MKNSNLKKSEANMKNVITKKSFSVTNQITATERYEMKELNMSTLDEIVGGCYHCDDSSWI